MTDHFAVSWTGRSVPGFIMTLLFAGGQDRHYTCNMSLKRVRATIVAFRNFFRKRVKSDATARVREKQTAWTECFNLLAPEFYI